MLWVGEVGVEDQDKSAISVKAKMSYFDDDTPYHVPCHGVTIARCCGAQISDSDSVFASREFSSLYLQRVIAHFDETNTWLPIP
jgi:hypothetical protein